MTLSLPLSKKAQAGHMERKRERGREWYLGSTRGCSHPDQDIKCAAKEAPWTSNPVLPSDNVRHSHCLTTVSIHRGPAQLFPDHPQNLEREQTVASNHYILGYFVTWPRGTRTLGLFSFYCLFHCTKNMTTRGG